MRAIFSSDLRRGRGDIADNRRADEQKVIIILRASPESGDTTGIYAERPAIRRSVRRAIWVVAIPLMAKYFYRAAIQ